MLEPVREAHKVFRGSLINLQLISQIEHYLETYYPEALWKVTIDAPAYSVAIDVTFKSPQDETFYRLKWS